MKINKDNNYFIFSETRKLNFNLNFYSNVIFNHINFFNKKYSLYKKEHTKKKSKRNI